MNISKKNTFRPDQFIYDKDSLVDCSNKSKLWMHSVDRKDTDNNTNMWLSFLLLIGFVIFVVAMMMLAALYPKAFPNNKPIVQHSANIKK